MKKDLFVPFDKGGNMCDYTYHTLSEYEEELCKKDGKFERFRNNGILAEIFVPNFEFDDTLLFEYFSRGRSSVKAHFVSCNTNKKYEMFISNLGDVIKANGLIEGKIKGKFTFVKKGQNYGIALVKGADNQ